MSEVSFQLKRFIESADYALNAVKINPSDESWIKPFGYFYAARSFEAAGEKENTQKYLNLAEDQNGYDYQKKLENMIKALAKKI
ncbi:MAG: hypothetical protein R6W90_01355 [Ignavibacteriaceae bacterium]